MDHGVVADQAHFGPAFDLPFGDTTAGNLADLGNVEHFQDLRIAEEGFVQLRIKHPRQGALNVVNEVIDYRIIADLNPLALRFITGLLVRADVKSDDRRI